MFTAYYGCIYPHLVYVLPIWGAESGKTLSIFRMQKKALRIILSISRNESCRGKFRSSNLLTFPCLYILESLTFLRKNFELFSPKSSYKNNISYNLRQADL